MSQNTYELIALAMRYFFAGMMLLIVLRAGRGALIDSRRAARLRKLSPMAGVVGELVVIEGDGKIRRGMRYPVIREGLIGSSRRADLSIRHPSVRRRHAYFQLTENGLRVRGHAGAKLYVAKHTPVREILLGDGGSFAVGKIRLLLVLGDGRSDEDALFAPHSPAIHSSDSDEPQSAPTDPDAPFRRPQEGEEVFGSDSDDSLYNRRENESGGNWQNEDSGEDEDFREDGYSRKGGYSREDEDPQRSEGRRAADFGEDLHSRRANVSGEGYYHRTADSEDAHNRRANVSGERYYHRTADSEDANERRADTSGNDCYRRAAGRRAVHFSGENRCRRSAEDDCNADDFESENRYRRSAEDDYNADDLETENRCRRSAEGVYNADDFESVNRCRRPAGDVYNADDLETENRYRRSAEDGYNADDLETENRCRRSAEDDYGTDDDFDDDFSDGDFFSVKSDYASKRRYTDERVPRNYRPARRSGTRKRRPDGEF